MENYKVIGHLCFEQDSEYCPAAKTVTSNLSFFRETLSFVIGLSGGKNCDFFSTFEKRALIFSFAEEMEVAIAE